MDDGGPGAVGAAVLRNVEREEWQGLGNVILQLQLMEEIIARVGIIVSLVAVTVNLVKVR